MSRLNGHEQYKFGGDGDQQASGLSDRLPPHNLDAERGVLGACLMDANAIETALEMLVIDDFYREAHQTVFRAIRDLTSQGIVADTVTVAEEMIRLGVYMKNGGDDLLAEIAGSIPHADNVSYHADIVRQKSVSRRLAQSHTETIRDVYSNLYTSEQLVDRATRELASIESDSNRGEVYDASLFRAWPSAPRDEIWYGLAGRFVRAIEPHSESDPVAILGQLLVCMGNVIGRKTHWMNEQNRHGLNLFLCVVGDTAQARKGSSWNHVRKLLYDLDDQWTTTRIKSGLTTGEGMIDQVRDRSVKRVKVGDVHEDREVDAGVDDKRVLFMESEFGSVLSNMGREGNNLAMVIRNAWDTGYLGTLSKNNPSVATNTHVSIVGHITEEELKAELTQNNKKNGFANRFLWMCARRSKLLPHGGQIHTVNFDPFIEEFKEVMRFVEVCVDETVPMLRDAHANQLWESVYAELSSSQPGIVGFITSRAAPMAMRLACLYAIFDTSMYVREEHLKAGLAFWDFCKSSVSWIWGGEIGDVEAVKVIDALKAARAEGLSRNQINRRCFSGRKSSPDLDQILIRLVRGSQIEPPVNLSRGGNSTHGRKWVLKGFLTIGTARSARSELPNDVNP